MRLDVNGLLNLIEEDPDVEYAEPDEYNEESYDEDTEISSEDACFRDDGRLLRTGINSAQ